MRIKPSEIALIFFGIFVSLIMIVAAVYFDVVKGARANEIAADATNLNARKEDLEQSIRGLENTILELNATIQGEKASQKAILAEIKKISNRPVPTTTLTTTPSTTVRTTTIRTTTTVVSRAS